MKQIIWWISLVIILSFSIFYFMKINNKEDITPDEDIAVIKEEKQCFSPDLNKEDSDKPLRIVALGDSLTFGIGDDKNEGGYIGKLEQKLANKNCIVTVTNYSKEGYKTKDLLQSLDDQQVTTAIEQSHIVMFTIGANDLVAIAKKEKMQFSSEVLAKAAEEYESNIEQALTTIRDLNSDIDIFVIGFYNPISTAIINNKDIDRLITKWNRISKKQTDKLDHAQFIRIDDLFKNKTSQYLAKDHFHPNHLGYEKIADRLVKTLQKGSE